MWHRCNGGDIIRFTEKYNYNLCINDTKKS